jgi:hypothetical protein
MFVEVTARVVGDDGVELMGMHSQRVLILGGDMHENLLNGATQLLEDVDAVKGAIMDQAAKLSEQLTPPRCVGYGGRRMHPERAMEWSAPTEMWVCAECGREEPMR